jgi:nucleoside phosphorylase
VNVVSTVSFADCRAAARRVRAAEHGPEALAVVRPRSVLGLVRSRAPLSVMLLVAAAEGRFVHPGPDSFALLERPLSAAGPRARGGLAVRLLRLIDRGWDWLIFTVPPLCLLGLALALRSPWFALAALVYVFVFMLAMLVNQSAWLRRTFGRRRPTPDELAAESLPGWNWSMPLCHHTAADGGKRLLQLAGDRMVDLVRRQVRQLAEAEGAEAEHVRIREVLVCLTRGVTTDAMRQTVADVLRVPYGPDARVAFRLPRDPVEGYRGPAQAGGGFFFLWLGGIAVVVAVLALMVSTWERQACAAGDCGQRPTTYLAALQWLAWRLLWQDAPGLVPGTVPTIVIGWLLSIVGLMTIPVTWVSVRLAISAHQRMLDDFEHLREPLVTNTRMLLLTVTAAERDAVLVAARSVTGTAAEHAFAGNLAIYELGAVAETTLGLVQCARPGAGGPGGAQATATEAIGYWKPHLIIMVGICGGLRDDWTPPQQLGDVIVASSIFDLDLRIRFDDHTELLGNRIPAGSGLVNRLQAASTNWSTARVQVGLLLTSQQLIDSRSYRDELKAENTRALGFDMEAHGLYTAAADAGVPWIVVKAISDWGVDRDGQYQGDPAAANAAGFLLHAVSTGAFGGVR